MPLRLSPEDMPTPGVFTRQGATAFEVVRIGAALLTKTPDELADIFWSQDDRLQAISGSPLDDLHATMEWFKAHARVLEAVHARVMIADGDHLGATGDAAMSTRPFRWPPSLFPRPKLFAGAPGRSTRQPPDSAAGDGRWLILPSLPLAQGRLSRTGLLSEVGRVHSSELCGPADGGHVGSPLP